jgi:hypothetical protein
MTMIKEVIRKNSPSLFRAFKGWRRQWAFRHGHQGSEYRAKRALTSRYGKSVICGPFAGMAYGDDVAGSAYVAKLVGSYEQELHAVIEEIIIDPPSTIVDIGCAEGYYAVGFARRLTSTAVYAFDTDLNAREYCKDLATRNRVRERVHIGGTCDHSTLATMAALSAFIFCDCEGYEVELLDLSKVPDLAKCDLLVELHDFIDPTISIRLLERFKSTHKIKLIDTVPRHVLDYPCLSHVRPGDREWAVREGRPATMQWAFMKAIQR